MSSLLPGVVANIWSYASPADIEDTAADEVKAAKSGYRHHVGSVQISNSETDVGTYVSILSGSTLLWIGFVNPFVVAAPGSSHIAAAFNPPLMGGIGEAINVACATTSAKVRACVQGFTTKAS